jgi:hypothetical protein
VRGAPKPFYTPWAQYSTVSDMICPCITICREKITIEQYASVCANLAKDAFRDCPVYQKLVKEAKTPSEWARSLVTPPP